MRWIGRCLVLAPVVCFIASALLLSCGGGSSSTSTGVFPLSLMSLAVCQGPPATLTPTMRPTHTVYASKTPTATATPMCSALASIGVGTPTSTGTATPEVLLLNVQGEFAHNANAKKHFHDITANCSLIWNIEPPGPLVSLQQCGNTTLLTSGEFVGVSAGCTCVTAQVGQLVSNVVTVSVGGAQNCACPTPTATPSP